MTTHIFCTFDTLNDCSIECLSLVSREIFEVMRIFDHDRHQSRDKTVWCHHLESNLLFVKRRTIITSLFS